MFIIDNVIDIKVSCFGICIIYILYATMKDTQIYNIKTMKEIINLSNF